MRQTLQPQLTISVEFIRAPELSIINDRSCAKLQGYQNFEDFIVSLYLREPLKLTSTFFVTIQNCNKSYQPLKFTPTGFHVNIFCSCLLKRIAV